MSPYQRKILQLNLCKSLQIPATRPAICVCRGDGSISVLDQTSAQTRESVGRAVVTPLQVPEQSRIRGNAHIVHHHCDTGEAREVCIFLLVYLGYGSHSSLTPKM
ncbi:unnamed protein product [Leuciscus chuanchicus]